MFRSWPIRKKMLVAGLIPALMMFFVLLLLFTSIRIEETKNHLYSIGRLTAQQVASASEFAVITGDTVWLDRLLKKTTKSEGIKSIKITDVTGEVLAEIREESQDTNNDKQFTADIMSAEGGIATEEIDWFQSSFDFTKSAYRVGSVIVTIDHSILSTKQYEIALDSFIVALVLLVFTWLIVKSVAHSISRPLQTLSTAVNAAAKGELKAIHIQGSPELIQLSNDINSLTDKINKSTQALENTIEELSKQKHKAELASKAKTDFLALMSHELRTPMNGVMGMLQLLSESKMTQQQQEQVLTGIQSTEHLLTVVNDILDFSRIESGKLNIEKVEFDLQALLENCFAAFKHEAISKGLEYTFHCTGKLANPAVLSDPTRLRQVMVNLIANAIKFTTSGKVSIEVSWHEEDDGMLYFHCDVKDTGIGIPPEKLARMFNSFEQADISTSRKYGGSGLGLSIVQRLIELMGGSIHVDSYETNGTHFKFTLRLKMSERTDRSATKIVLPENKLSDVQGHVLVVEDNQVNLKVTVAMLQKLGLTVDSAENGQEAIDLFLNNRYDIIFMDCQMPVMDGFLATSNIRQIEQREKRKKTPIVALTANAIKGVEQECMKCGMDDYMTKPVKKDLLREKAITWLGES